MKDFTTHNANFGSYNHADPKIHTIADICMAFKLRPNDNLAAILHYSGALDGVIKDPDTSPVPTEFLMQRYDVDNFVDSCKRNLLEKFRGPYRRKDIHTNTALDNVRDYLNTLLRNLDSSEQEENRILSYLETPYSYLNYIIVYGCNETDFTARIAKLLEIAQLCTEQTLGKIIILCTDRMLWTDCEESYYKIAVKKILDTKASKILDNIKPSNHDKNNISLINQLIEKIYKQESVEHLDLCAQSHMQFAKICYYIENHSEMIRDTELASLAHNYFDTYKKIKTEIPELAPRTHAFGFFELVENQASPDSIAKKLEDLHNSEAVSTLHQDILETPVINDLHVLIQNSTIHTESTEHNLAATTEKEGNSIINERVRGLITDQYGPECIPTEHDLVNLIVDRARRKSLILSNTELDYIHIQKTEATSDDCMRKFINTLPDDEENMILAITSTPYGPEQALLLEYLPTYNMNIHKTISANTREVFSTEELLASLGKFILRAQGIKQYIRNIRSAQEFAELMISPPSSDEKTDCRSFSKENDHNSEYSLTSTDRTSQESTDSDNGRKLEF